MNRQQKAAIRAQAMADMMAGVPIEIVAVTSGLCDGYLRVLWRKSVGGNIVSMADWKAMKRRAIVAEMHSLGASTASVLRLLGVSYSTLGKDCRALGVKLAYDMTGRAGVFSHSERRAAAMAAMYQSGKTLQQIADLFGISRERIRQLIKKHTGLVGKDGGQSKIAADRAAARRAAREATCQRVHGCSLEQHEHLRRLGREHVKQGGSIYTSPIGAFTNQRRNANTRGIEWKMNLWQWWTIWQESGKWDRRGRGRDDYVMCRFGDTGGYEQGNVYIATQRHNGTVQPNNPYRLGHPDHAETMARARTASSADAMVSA